MGNMVGLLMETIVKICDERVMRVKLFRIPFMRMRREGGGTIDLTHKEAELLLKEIYPRLPEDIYVNSVSVEPGYAAFSILASSKTFEPVKDFDALILYPLHEERV